MKKGIVVAFPGIRYTCGQPLVQDCLAFYKARGYETLCLDFAGVSFDGTADMSRAAEAALPSILGQLSGVCFADYTDVVFLAKSLGTLCAVRTAKALAMQPRFFLLTPLEETLQELPPDGNVFGAVVGTKDAHLPAARLEQFCRERAVPCLLVPEVGHRLQFEDAAKTESVNRSIVAMLR